MGCTVRVLCAYKPLNVALRVTYVGRTGSAGKFKVPNLHRPHRIHCSNVYFYVRVLVSLANGSFDSVDKNT